MRQSSPRSRLLAMLSTLLVAAGGTVVLTAAPAANLGVHEHQVGGVDVTLLEVKRTSGDMINVRWEYHNKTSEKKQLTDQRTGWLDPYRLAAEAYLIDGANRTRYPVMRDSTNHPVSAKIGGQNSYIFLGPKQTLVTWAKFAAPGPDVDKVTVVLPGVEPFEDVPIAK